MTPAADPPPLGLWTTPGIDAAAVASQLLANASELIGIIDGELRLVAVNDRLLQATGYTAAELVGAPALDVIAPEDVERAALMLGLSGGDTTPAGTGGFGLRCADGTTVETYVTACTIEVGGALHTAAVGRPTFMPGAMDSILDGLLEGRDLTATLAPILEFFAWRENGSRIAITWTDPADGSAHTVSTGLEAGLAGRDVRPGDPWDRARRTGQPVETHRDELDEARRAAAEALQVDRVWIVPVRTDGTTAALVTAWTASPRLDPRMHGYAMAAAVRHITLALRWTAQVRSLDRAANTDALTGLANRRAFFEAVERSSRSGAVLYCDLDGFKPVNDRWGHAAGDDVLVEVADRIRGATRAGDLVARLGGDEFAIVLWEATSEAAEEVADRIRAAGARPFVLPRATVAVGVSVGLAHSDGPVDEALVDLADERLYDAKRSRGGASGRPQNESGSGSRSS